MTNKKAINAIKEDNCYGCYGSKEDCEICAYGVAIEALEKRIPKKPIAREHNELRGEILFHCPTCDDDFNCNEYEDSYCAECGQAIDWSEEEC